MRQSTVWTAIGCSAIGGPIILAILVLGLAVICC